MSDNTEDSNQPTETSPLLPSDQIQSTEPPDGIPPGGASLNGSLKANGKPVGEDDGDTLERQTSGEDRQKQYEGMPEVKKEMKYILPALAIGIYLGAADQTIIVSSAGNIGSDLNALNQTSWIATAYFLTLTSFQPLYGKLSDIFGRKECLLFTYAVFGIGCLFCGLAQNMTQLIAARAFAGIGGGGMNTIVSILISDIIGLRERGKWQGYLNIIFATGASSGAPLGGILSDYVGWRWAFLGQTPLVVAAIVAVSFALHLPKQDDAGWWKKLRRIDLLGAIVLITAVFTLLLALDRGSNIGWKDPVTLISLGISIPLFVTFALVEMKVAKEPFAPGHIIFHRTMIACFLCNFFSMAGWIAAIFYTPLYFQAVHNTSATGAGLRLIPSMICSVSGSLFAGSYMARTGKYYWLAVICYALLTLGMAVIYLFSGVLVDSQVGVILAMCVGSFGSGNGATLTLIGLIANASREDQAIATACSYLFRSLGSVFGLSMSATVANQVLRKNLAVELPALGLSKKKAYEIAVNVRQSLAYLRHLEPEVKAIVTECYARSTSAAFGLQIGLVAGAFISAWFIKEKALSK